MTEEEKRKLLAQNLRSPRSLKYGVGAQDVGNRGSLKDIIRFGAQMLPMSDISREVGASNLEPSIWENIKNKNYTDAILNGVGTFS